MLMTPDEITRQIELIAASEANALGIRISTDAIIRLAIVPPNFLGDMAQIDVQIPELRRPVGVRTVSVGKARCGIHDISPTGNRRFPRRLLGPPDDQFLGGSPADRS
jgi:hypothetical protein